MADNNKVLITMIGAGPAFPTKYAKFETTKNGYHLLKNENSLYNKSGISEYQYPFLATCQEKEFDHIVLIGTSGSKWGILCKNILDSVEKMVGEQADGEEIKAKFIKKFYALVKESDINSDGDDKKVQRERAAEYLDTEGLLKANDRRQEMEEFLHQCMQFLFHADKGYAIEIVLVIEGRTDWENKENVERVMRQLVKMQSEKAISEITLDVSNALRSHPMYVLAVINNISAIEGINIPIDIYYGMYDVKVKQDGSDNYLAVSSNSHGPKKMVSKADQSSIQEIAPMAKQDSVQEIAPMANLSSIQEIDAWTRAIKEFHANGSVISLLNLINESSEYFNEKDKDNYLKSFDDFFFAVNSNDLSLFSNAIDEIHNLIDKQNKNIKGKSDKMPIYVELSIRCVILDIKKQFDWKDDEKNKNSAYMFSIARWYLGQDRLGDSVRTFQEAFITYIMEKYPDMVSELLDKRMYRWSGTDCVDEHLFDADVRQKLREEIFRGIEEDMEYSEEEMGRWSEWNNWIEEYEYMREYIHDSQKLLFHISIEKDDRKKQEKELSQSEHAKKHIEKFAEKMQMEIQGKTTIIKNRIEYLLSMDSHDVFISYRRSYHEDGQNDGVLIMSSIYWHLENKGLKVFIDKDKMEGKEGEFTDHLHKNLVNSKLCLVILGENCFKRDYNEKDEYYKEIITAVKEREKGRMKIAVLCMKGFSDDPASLGKGVGQQKELMSVASGYQRIGGGHTPEWENQQIMTLPEIAYKELNMMLNEN